MYRYDLLVSVADGINEPFTSQTSPVSPTVFLCDAVIELSILW